MKKPVINRNQDNVFKQALSNYLVCDFCIGRLCAQNKSIDEFKILGEQKRKTLIDINKISDNECELCDGILFELDHLVGLIKESVKGYDFSSFVLGFHIDQEILDKEEQIVDLIKPMDIEPLKIFLKKTIGTSIERDLGKSVSFDDPDIMIIVNTMFLTVNLQIKSLYIYGRYNKYQSGIPQTKWFCRQCSGIGCRNCNYTGSLYESSVEEYIAPYFVEAFDAESWSFHGSGREDIDVKMLGSGRPFILELNNPKKRSSNLSEIQHEINKNHDGVIKVSNLFITEKDDVSRIKESSFHKVYEITFKTENPFDTEKLKKVALTLRGTIIQQFTPTRVAHRRANKVRERKIYNCSVVSVNDNQARFRIESASGTYIKELVTGDNGKTKPSISELVGQPCEVISLDVMEIKGE